MVHLVRNSTKYIPTKNRKEFCADLKAIYGAVSISEAENALAVLNEKWKKQYPSAVRVWNDNFIYVQRIFEYPSEIRKMIYTTNAIESFNSSLRKVTDRKAAFPNEMAVMKILYLRTRDVIKKWTMPYSNWGVIRGMLDLLWGHGWDSQILCERLHNLVDNVFSAQAVYMTAYRIGFISHWIFSPYSLIKLPV